MRKTILTALLLALPLVCFGQDATTEATPKYEETKKDAVAVEKIIELTKKDLATLLGINKEEIKLKSIEKVTWPNSALGFPEEGYGYLEVLIDGYKIILSYDSKDYEYHTGGFHLDEPIIKLDPKVKEQFR